MSMSIGIWVNLTTSFRRVLFPVYFAITGSMPVIGAETTPTLTFNTSHIPPFTTSQQDGFEDRLAIELFQRLGFQLRIIISPSERALSNVNEGLDDGLMPRVAGLEKRYANLVRTHESVAKWNYVAFTNKPEIIIKEWESLAELNVAYVHGWKIFESQVKRYKTILPVRTSIQLFELLNAGRVDVVLFAELPGRWLVKNLGLRNIRVSGNSLAVKEQYFYLHNKHRGLIPKVDNLLKEMKADGSYDQLYRQTITPILDK